MQRVITPKESERLDRVSSEPLDLLMERAGFSVAIATAMLGAGYGKRVVVLVGSGNNGGDGYVAARYLADRGCAVRVLALRTPQGAFVEQAAARAAARGVEIDELGSLLPADFVVDALFGVGFRGELPASAAAWIAHPAPVVSVDVPSGLDAATGAVRGACFTASRTVAFHALKTGHLLGEGPERCGEIEVVDIGLEGGEAELLLCGQEDAPLPERVRKEHKWSAGSVVVVGGSLGLTGAPLLAATAALKMGAGSAAIICPGALQNVYAAASSDLMTRAVGSGTKFASKDDEAVLAAASRFDTMVLGPGLGPNQEAFVSKILAKWTGKLVVDADALNALDGADALGERAIATVITPHAGEFIRLTGKSADYKSAADFYDASHAVVVLKGNPTFVSGAERWVVTSGGPELATIGTGDVLAGMIGALWARGLSSDVAARSAAYWHGRAGSYLSDRGSVTAALLAESVSRYAF